MGLNGSKLSHGLTLKRRKSPISDCGRIVLNSLRIESQALQKLPKLFACLTCFACHHHSYLSTTRATQLLLDGGQCSGSYGFENLISGSSGMRSPRQGFDSTLLLAIAGVVFINLPEGSSSTQQRLALLFFMLLLYQLMPFCFMSFYVADRRFFQADVAADLYAPSAYYLAAVSASTSSFTACNVWLRHLRGSRDLMRIKPAESSSLPPKGFRGG